MTPTATINATRTNRCVELLSTLVANDFDPPFVFNLPPLPLAGGRRYVWRLAIDGETRDDWAVAFMTRSP